MYTFIPWTQKIMPSVKKTMFCEEYGICASFHNKGFIRVKKKPKTIPKTLKNQKKIPKKPKNPLKKLKIPQKKYDVHYFRL